MVGRMGTLVDMIPPLQVRVVHYINECIMAQNLRGGGVGG
jgi:hypothetical protein